MPNVHAVHARFGFMETPDVREALRGARQRGLRIDDADCTYFVGWHLVRAIDAARARPASKRKCSRTCSGAARRPPSSSACRRSASSCSRPRSTSSLVPRAQR